MTQAEKTTTHSSKQVDGDMRRCIQECRDCEALCLQTLSYCLEKGGAHAAADHVRALIDCAKTCSVGADFMLRGSPLHTKTCGTCAEACRVCAESCEKMGDDPRMKACAEACRRCADSCRKMATAH